MIRLNISKHTRGTILRKSETEGETIEQKMARIITNNEPITDGAPIIYMERKDGIIPDYDVRTDRWDHAITAMDVNTKTKLAQRDKRQADIKKSDKAEPTPGTDDKKDPAA